MHSIGVRLKAWRESQKLTQPEAATRLGVNFRSYQNYEGDVRPPKSDSLESFARAGINTNWLLTGEGEMLLNQGVKNSQEQLHGHQAQYMVAEPAPQPASVVAVDPALMRLCLGACVMVHGEAFASEPTALQLEYVCELYNLLLKQAATHDQGVKAGLADFTRLETRGIADQLRLLLHLTWARRYTPPRKKTPIPPDLQNLMF